MSKYSLPNMEFSFEYQGKGEESGMNWTGSFTYRRPTLRERALIDVMSKRMAGDLSTVSQDVAYYNEASAHLRFTLKSYPEWWKDSDFGGMLYDANVIMDLYDKVLEFEAKWREKTFGEEDGVEVGSDQGTTGEASA